MTDPDVQHFLPHFFVPNSQPGGLLDQYVISPLRCQKSFVTLPFADQFFLGISMRNILCHSSLGEFPKVTDT